VPGTSARVGEVPGTSQTYPKLISVQFQDADPLNCVSSQSARHRSRETPWRGIGMLTDITILSSIRIQVGTRSGMDVLGILQAVT
jgi:hypothetical protein